MNVNSDIAIKTLEGLSVLAKGKVSSQIKVSTKLLFSFKNVKQVHVDNEILFREFISISKPSIKSEEILNKLQKGKLFIVSEVLQTTDFTVRDASDFEISGNLQAEAIEKFASLKANVNAEKESDLKISYEGENKPPITFAIKAYRILHKDGKYSLDKTTLKIVRGEGKDNLDKLQTEDGVVWCD